MHYRRIDVMEAKKTLEAVKEALDNSPERKFVETVELSINIKDVDLSMPKNRIEEEIPLPKGRGKTIKVGVFGSGELAVKAKGVADTVIQPEQIDEMADDKKSAKKLVNEHQFFLAEAPLMPIIGKKLGVILGPRGRMPRPVPPGMDPSSMIENLRRTVKVRSRDKMTFHVAVGTKDMSPEDLTANIDAVFGRILPKLERGKMNIQSIYVKTTMGPSVRIEL